MARQELEILLRAKNETDAAFKALSQAVRAVEGEQQKVAGGFTAQAKAVDDWFGRHDRALKGIVAGAGLVGAAVAGMGLTLNALGERGSKVLNVSSAFDSLTKAAGISASTMLGEVRKSTLSMVSDYDLMLNANRVLGAQLPITSKQFAESAGMAIQLGRAVGKDASESLERFSQGLAKVEPELLDELNITVDAVAANKELAKSLGISTDALTSQQRQIAFTNAVLEQMRERTAAMGEIQLTFADRVAQGKIALSNMWDAVSEGVALSPSLNTAIEMIGKSILDAFGTDRQQTIQKVIEWVDYFAQMSVKAAQAAITGAKGIGQAYYTLRTVFETQMQLVTSAIELPMVALGKLFEYLGKLPNPMASTYRAISKEIQEFTTWVDGARQGFGQAATESMQKSAAWAKQADALNGQLDTLLKAMQKSAAEGPKVAAATATNTKRTDENTTSTEANEKAIAKAKKELDAFLKVIDHQIDALGISNQELKWAAVYWDKFDTAVLNVGIRTMPPTIGAISSLTTGIDKVGISVDTVTPKTIDLAAGFEDLAEQADDLKDALDDIGETNAQTIVGSFQSIASGIGGAFGNILSGWTSLFDQMITVSKDKNGALWQWMSSPGASRAAGGISAGIGGYSTGYDLAGMTGTTSWWKGGLAGAAGGAGTGAAIGAPAGGIGAGVGALIGGIAGFAGGVMAARKNKKEQEAALAEIQQDLLKTYGSMQKLQEAADAVGVSIDKAFTSKKPKDALAVIQQFEQATQALEAKLAGIETATEGLNTRVLASFVGAVDASTGAVMNLGEEGQKQFERLGIYAAATLGAQVKETGNLVTALDAIGPSLDHLVKAQQTFGFEGSETINKLLGIRRVVTTNRDVFDSLAGLNQLMKGFGDSSLMTHGLFQTFAEDAAAQYDALMNRGVDANDALALMAPTLQELYEGQSKYGQITDETTKKLIDQAKEQGLVGDHMKDVNEQILQATLDISSAIKDLAAVLRGELPAAATAAAAGITGAFKDVKVTIPVEYEHSGMPGERWSGGGGEYPGAATGAVIPFTPGGGRLIRAGERSTEYLVDDAQIANIAARVAAAMGGGGGGGTVIIRNEIGGRLVNEHIVDTTKAGLRNGRIPVPRSSIVERAY